MRNLKKILALVLALVMSMSLVTIANASDFTDADDITYEEAADVMSTIGVIEGYEDGSFDPDGTLVREEAAKLVTFMLLGDNANNLGIERSSFNDVAMTRWSAPAIEYCVSLGIIDGAGDGNFYPRGQLTAVAFAKVLLTALGYDADTEGLVGATWSVNTAALAMEVGLDNGIEDLSWNAALTREEAAQMALNAIQAPLVAYENDVTIVVGDTPVSFGSGDAYYITTTLAREQRISDEQLSNSNDYTVEFGERYFPRLRLNRETDDFERPSHTWVYENTELGTYVDYDLLVETYTAGVSGRTLYELLSRSTIEKYSLTYYVDGVETELSKNLLVRSNTSNVGQTGNGVLTQVFVDHDNDEIVITSIHTYLAQANGDYNEKSETVSLKVFDQVTDGTAGDTQIIDVAEVPNIVDIVKDQYVLVNMSGKDTGTAADLEVVKVSDVEILTDTDVTKFSTDKDSDKVPSIFDSLTADGEDYSASYKAFYNVDALNLYDNALLTNTSYNVYLDQYGYAIGVDLYAGEMNYVFITGYDRPESNISVRTAQAAAIFLDGTMKEITVNVTNTTKNLEDRTNTARVDGDYDEKYAFWTNDGEYDLNRWFSYTETDGVYTLRPVDEGRMLITDYASIVDATDSAIINCSNVFVQDNVNGLVSHTASNIRGYGNDNSVYITVEPGKVDTSYNQNAAIVDVSGLYTGVQNVDIEMTLATKEKVDHYVYTLIDDDQYIIASIVLGEAQGSTANYAFITAAPTSERIDRETGIYYWSFDAIMGGKKVTLEARSKYQSTVDELIRGLNSVVELRFDGDYVTSVKPVTSIMSTFETLNPDNYEVFDVDTNQYANDFVNLYLNGRTLHTGNQSTGLTFVSGAPTVLKQTINNKSTTTEYNSVEEAYNDLADAKPNETVNPGLQFQGRIVAVLNSQGVAEWVYIISDTPVSSGNQGGYQDEHNYGSMAAGVVTAHIYGVVNPGDPAVSAVATEYLESLGYTVLNSVYNGTGYTIQASVGGVGYTFTTALDTLMRVNLNGNLKGYYSAGSTANLTGLTGKYVTDAAANADGSYSAVGAVSISAAGAASYSVPVATLTTTNFDVNLTDGLYKVSVDGGSTFKLYKNGATISGFTGNWVNNTAVTPPEQIQIVNGAITVNGKDITVTMPAVAQVKVTIHHADGTTDEVYTSAGSTISNSGGKLSHYFTVGAPKDDAVFTKASEGYMVGATDVELYDGFRKVTSKTVDLTTLTSATGSWGGTTYTSLGTEYAAIGSEITYTVNLPAGGYAVGASPLVLEGTVGGTGATASAAVTGCKDASGTQAAKGGTPTAPTVTFAANTGYSTGSVTFTFTVGNADVTLSVSDH